MNDIKLEQSFKYCKRLTYCNAKNFYFSFLFLKKELRNAIYTVYAFCRIADDIADDETLTVEQKKIEFNKFDSLFYDCYTDKKIKHPMFTALQYVIKKYELSQEYLYDIVLGVRQDLYKTHYNEFQELFDYCFKVASRVAYVCIELFVPEKYKTKDLYKYADYLGIALQLTNILRDVKEDSERDRRYIPLDWLNDSGLTEQEYENAIQNNNVEKLNNLFSNIIFRIEKYYSDCDLYINDSQKKYLVTLEIIKSIYFELLNKIKYDYDKILCSRVSLSFIQKLKITVKIRFFR